MLAEQTPQITKPEFVIYAQGERYLYAGIGRLFINILRDNYDASDIHVRIPFLTALEQKYDWWAALTLFLVTKWNKNSIEELQMQFEKYMTKCRTVAIFYADSNLAMNIFKPTYNIVAQCALPTVYTEFFVKEEEAISWLLKREPGLQLNETDLLSIIRKLSKQP